MANITSAGPSTLNNVRDGGFSLQRPDGKYLLIDGTNTNKTEVYDAGWYRTGSYVSEKLHPADINFWNVFSWVRDADDTLTTKIRTATSSAGLDVASWRTVANGGNVNPGAGETWLQIGADDARAIPRSTLAQEDVWGKWRADFRAWPRPLVLSFTANYTPTGLSVSPGKTTFAYGGRPLDVWVPADSSVVTNDGTASENLLAKISTFTAGASTWSLSAQWSTATAAGPWNDVAAYDQNFTIGTSVGIGGSVKLYFRIQTPTASPANIQYASTLTVTGQ